MYLSSQKSMEVLKSGLIFQINFEGLRLKLGRIAPEEKETDIKTRTPPPSRLTSQKYLRSSFQSILGF